MLDKSKVERFISSAMRYKGNKYSIPKRMVRGYSDCSSLIYKGLNDAGLLDTSKTTRTVSTKFMRDGDPRFERISMNDIQRGDILWWQKPNSSTYSGHVAIYLGNGRVLEAIYEGVVEKSSKRIPYQRAYRVKTMKAKPKQVTPKKEETKITTVKVQFERKNVTVQTIKKDDRNYVGIRELFEKLGYTVKWDNVTKTIIIY